MKELTGLSKKELIKKMLACDEKVKKILLSSADQERVRNRLFYYLNHYERIYFNVHSPLYLKKLHMVRKVKAKECIKQLKNILRTENEEITGVSALKTLIGLARGDEKTTSETSESFVCEIISLLKGVNGKPDIFESGRVLHFRGRKGAVERSANLDAYSRKMEEYFSRYKSALDPEISAKREKLKSKILRYFGGKSSDWSDYKWHLRRIIRDKKTLFELVKLEKDEIEGVEKAEKYGIPFHITPYYLSLFNENGRTFNDKVVRAQVLPSEKYCDAVFDNWKEGGDMDFMGERDTGPVDLITRRYPKILILKPFDSCPQICVYCQRNWEIKSMDEARITVDKINAAIKWIKNNKHISEVLITGGDPFTLNNRMLDWLMGEVAAIKHVERIRIGTRTLVTLPQRMDEGLLKILRKHHEWGKKEICVITHFEHSMEMTKESLEAVKKIKKLGMNIYNQQVFTYYNSKRFETAFIRKALKISGILPYYLFNTKGKKETKDFRVPIARIIQEKEEESRIQPGVVRTDEAVFNVPRLGKSKLQATHEHEIIMIKPSGERVYRFYPWESKSVLVDPQIYEDVPIYTYLKRLREDGEDPDDYRTIWYYF